MTRICQQPRPLRCAGASASLIPIMSAPTLPKPELETRLLHADHPDANKDPAHPIAPAMSLSTTFRQPHPDSEMAQLARASYDTPENPPVNIYSRYTQDTSLRAEKVLSSLLDAHAITFSSGLAASFAILNLLAPSAIAIRRGYFGVHEAAHIYARGRDTKIIDLDEDFPVNEGTLDEATGIRRGATLVWVETPLNPTGEARDLVHYTKRAHEAKAYIAVDSTFAPPPLQNPFNQGVDFVMHSATKYMGGHSDILAGVVATKDYKSYKALWDDRSAHGAVLGSLEAYLLLRSLRTMSLRVRQQSKTATELVKWLHSLTEGQTPAEGTPKEIANGQFVQRVFHSTLQPRTDKDSDLNPHNKLEKLDFDPSKQMPGGGSPTFAIFTKEEKFAVYLPHELAYFVPATSLGGVESLIEQRKLATKDESPNIVRISTGIEDFEDLKADLTRGMLQTLAKHK